MPPKTRQSSDSKHYPSNKRDVNQTSQKEAQIKASTNFEAQTSLDEEHSQTPPASDETIADAGKTTEKPGNSETNQETNEDHTNKHEKGDNPLENNGGSYKGKQTLGRQRNVSNNRAPGKGGTKKEALKEPTVNTDVLIESNESNETSKNTGTVRASNPGSDGNQESGDNQKQEHAADAGSSTNPQNSKLSRQGSKQRPNKVSRNNFFDNPPIDGRVKQKTHPYERMTNIRGSAQKDGQGLQSKRPSKQKTIEKTQTEEDDDWAEELFDDPYRTTPVQGDSSTTKETSRIPKSPDLAVTNGPPKEHPEQYKKPDKKPGDSENTRPGNKPGGAQRMNPQIGRGKPTQSRIRAGKTGVERPQSRLKTGSKSTELPPVDASGDSTVLKASLTEESGKTPSSQQKPEEDTEEKQETPGAAEIQVESIEDTASTDGHTKLPEVKKVEAPKTQSKGPAKTSSNDPQKSQKLRGTRPNRNIAANSNHPSVKDEAKTSRANNEAKTTDAQINLDELMKEVKDDEELEDLLPPPLAAGEKQGKQQSDRKARKGAGRGPQKTNPPPAGKKGKNKATPRTIEMKVQSDIGNIETVNEGADAALQKANDNEDKPEEVSDTEMPLNLDDDTSRDVQSQKTKQSAAVAKGRDPLKRDGSFAQDDSIDDLIDASASMNGHSALARKRKPSNTESFGGGVPTGVNSEVGNNSTPLETEGNEGSTNNKQNRKEKKKFVKGEKDWLLNKGLAKPVPQSMKVSTTRVEKEVGKIRLDGEPNSDEELPPEPEAEENAENAEGDEKPNEDDESAEKDEDKPKLDAYGRPIRTKSAILRAKEVIDSKEMSESTENLLKALCEDAIDELIRNAEQSYTENRVNSPTDTIDFVANENKEDPNKAVKKGRRKKVDEYVPARYTFATFRNCPCILCTRKKPRKMKFLTRNGKKKEKLAEETVEEEKEPGEEEEAEPDLEPEAAAEVDPQRQLAEAAAEELLRTSEAHPINGDQPIELNASGMVVQRIIEMSASLPTSQLLWRITDVKHKIQTAKKETTVTIFSQAFYTAPHGYKLICATCPYGNKQGFGKYLPVYFFVCKGKWDNLLPWPFSPEITVTLLDQNMEPDKRQDLVFSFKPDTNDPVLVKSLQQPTKERNTYFGLNKFAPLKCLSPSKFSYVRDDVMFLQVFVRSDKMLVI